MFGTFVRSLGLSIAARTASIKLARKTRKGKIQETLEAILGIPILAVLGKGGEDVK